jgi:hypothetical protein
MLSKCFYKQTTSRWPRSRDQLNVIGVARWFIFIPQKNIFVIIWETLEWKISKFFATIWYCFGQLVSFLGLWYMYFVVICDYFAILVHCTKKNLATVNVTQAELSCM